MNESKNASVEVPAGLCEVRPDELRQIEGGSLMTAVMDAIRDYNAQVGVLTGILAANHAAGQAIVRNL